MKILFLVLAILIGLTVLFIRNTGDDQSALPGNTPASNEAAVKRPKNVPELRIGGD